MSEPTDVRESGPQARAALPLEAESVGKSFIGGDGKPLQILDGLDLRVDSGEAVAIVGASGAGKSTFLHILGALDRPTSGCVRLKGQDVSKLGDEALAEVRNQHVGFVFQFHHLLREFTAVENVMMPGLVGSLDFRGARERARSLLAEVGLDHRETHRPRQLSGGEQQRVAVARALMNQPLVLLADEPSGNLDKRTSERLHDLLFELKERRNLSLVVVTHNTDLASRADRVLQLDGGRLHPNPQV